MNISLHKDAIHKQLSLVSRFISSRPALPVLANVLIETDDQGIILSTTNLDITVKVQTNAKIDQPGRLTAPAKALYELINILPSGKIDLLDDDNQLTVKTDETVSNFNIITPEDFPVLPSFNQQNAIGLSFSILQEVSEKILFAASSDESRPILTSILLKQQQDQMTFVATDGFRLSEVTRKVEGQQLEEGKILLLPAKIISELIKIGTDNKADTLWIDITTQTNQLALKVAQVEFFSKLINGTYPPYERIIPTDFQTTIEVDAEELAQAVRVSNIFSRDTGSQVRLQIDPEQKSLQVAAQSSNLGQNTSTLPITGQGQPLTISFNNKFLLDILNVLHKGTLQLHFKSAEAPMLVQSPTLPDFRHIIMPLKQ